MAAKWYFMVDLVVFIINLFVVQPTYYGTHAYNNIIILTLC